MASQFEKALDQLASHGTPAARFAIETSFLDLICKEIGEPLHNWLTTDSPNNIRVNSSIGTLNDKTSQMAEVKCDLTLDESVTRFTTNNRLDSFPVARMIIKPSIRGGVLPSLSLAREAGRLRLHTVVTSTLEAAPGIWADAHLVQPLLTISTRPSLMALHQPLVLRKPGSGSSIVRRTLALVPDLARISSEKNINSTGRKPV